MNGRRLSSWVVTCAVAMGLQACPNPPEKLAPDSGDVLENAEMKLSETSIVATGSEPGGDMHVTLNLVSKKPSGLRANWTVWLLRDGYVVGSDRGTLRADTDGLYTINATLAASAPDLSTDPGLTLGGQVIQYSIRTDGGELRGRRALSGAWRRQDVLILGSDTFDPRSPSLVRVIVHDPSTGAPLDAKVTADLALAGADRQLYRGRTDESGAAEITLSAGPSEAGEAVLRIMVESELATDLFEVPITIASAEKILVTTDKPLYQPGQTLYIRTLTLDRASLRPAAERDLVLEVQDAEGNYLMRETLQTDAFGIASWDFPLATELNTGTWIITARMGEMTATRTVVVDRYKLPRFSAQIQLDREAARPLDHVRATVAARYFFGEPVAGGELVVQVMTEAGPAGPPIATLLDADGVASVDLAMPALAGTTGVDAQIVAAVTDKTGQQFTARRIVPVTTTDILLSLLPMANLVPDAPNRFLVLTSLPSRAPIAAQCDLTIDRERLDFDTDETGVAVISATLPGGLVTVPVQLECGAGQLFALRSWQIDLTEALRSGVMSVEADKALYQAGDAAQIKVRYRSAGLEADALAGPLQIDVLRGGHILDSVSAQPNQTVEIPIDAGWWGTLQFEAYAVTVGGQLRRSRALAYVAPSRRLDVRFATDKPLYRPGEDAILRVSVTDEEGRPAVAAVGLNIVDEAVYALQDTKPGLEKLTFQIDAPRSHAEVAAHGYSARQVVTGDPARRDAAALAVFATTDAAGHGIEIQSRAANDAGVRQASAALFQADLTRVAERFNVALQYPGLSGGDVFWNPGLVERLLDEVQPTYDPWGRPYVIRPDASQGYVTGFTVISAGPDEIGGTEDDLAGALYANGYYVGVL